MNHSTLTFSIQSHKTKHLIFRAFVLPRTMGKTSAFLPVAHRQLTTIYHTNRSESGPMSQSIFVHFSLYYFF